VANGRFGIEFLLLVERQFKECCGGFEDILLKFTRNAVACDLEEACGNACSTHACYDFVRLRWARVCEKGRDIDGGDIEWCGFLGWRNCRRHCCGSRRRSPHADFVQYIQLTLARSKVGTMSSANLGIVRSFGLSDSRAQHTCAMRTRVAYRSPTIYTLSSLPTKKDEACWSSSSGHRCTAKAGRFRLYDRHWPLVTL